jgi:adenosylhomocysteine nucleosidase
MSNPTAIPLAELLADKLVLFVMAVSAEYGQELRKRFEPLFTEVGPVEAAAATAAALASLKSAGKLPQLIVSLGSAGSNTLEQGQVYQVSHVSYRDMDASPLGFPKGITPFLDLPAVIELPFRIPSLQTARLSTGADIVSGSAYDGVASDMVDMETYAVLRAAMRFRVPLIGLRGISDGKEELRHYNDWHQYLHVVDEKLAAAVDLLAEALAGGDISIPHVYPLPPVGEGGEDN